MSPMSSRLNGYPHMLYLFLIHYYPRTALAFGYYRCLRLSVRPSVRQSVRPSITKFVRAITHYPFKLGSPNLKHRGNRPWLRSLLFWGWLTLTFKVKFNFKVKIYPSLSLWVCPHHKSPRIVVRISKFGPKMHLSTVKVRINFGIDWASSSVSGSISYLLFSNKLSVSYSFASVCIYLVRPSPVNAPHSTWHRTYTDSHARGQGRAMDHDIVWFDILVGPSEINEPSTRRLALDFTSSYRFSPNYTTSHAAILYANSRQSRK